MADKPGWLARLLGRGSSKPRRDSGESSAGHDSDPAQTQHADAGRGGETALAGSPRAVQTPPRPAAGAPPLTPEDAVPDEWNAGDVILDLYEVKGVLGEGGMGKVYRVHHRGWNVDLAVKSPGGTVFSSSEAKDNFAREAETWVKLGLHPHIVACYYVRTLGGIPRVFAEYLEGGSLSDWIESRKLYEGGPAEALRRILDIAIQFAWGLDYAHQQGLVHQDVKPANVMMTADGVAKVSDFGLAQARALAGAGAAASAPGHSVLVAGAGFMTREYCSPEQARGGPLSRKTDVWSWGLSVLEMFTAERTWATGLAAPDVLEGYLDARFEDDGMPRMPFGLAELLRECFADDPADRPATMAEVARHLQRVYERDVPVPFGREAPKPAEAMADSLNNRACSLWDLGRQDEALGSWQEALRLQPQHPEATYNRGLMLWRLARGDDVTLLKHLRASLESHRTNWTVHYLLALSCLECGDRRTAAAALKGIPASDAGRGEVRVALAAAGDRLAGSSGMVRSLEGHLDWAQSVDLSADGSLALSGSDDKTMKLWDLRTGRCLCTLEGHLDRVSSASLGSDTRHAVSGSYDKTVKLWDLRTGRCVRTMEGHSDRVSSVVFGPDGRHALSGSHDQTLKLWDVATGVQIRTLRGHADGVTSVSLSRDGRVALSGSSDKTMRLWDVRTGRCLGTLEGHPAPVRSVSLSADARHALSGGDDRTLRVWDLETGRCLRTLEGHTRGVSSTDLSSDGRHALTGSLDGSIKLWELASGRCLQTFEGHAFVTSARLSSDGRHVVSAGDTLMLWRFDVDNDWRSPLALCSPTASERLVAGQAEHQREMQKARAALAAENVLACAQHLRRARSQVGFSRDPEAFRAWATLYSRLPRVKLVGGWEALTFERRLEAVHSVDVTADGRHALSGGDEALSLWDVSTGQCLRTFEGHTGAVRSVRLSADGRHALSGGDDRTPRLWDVQTGSCIRTMEGHTDSVQSVDLSGDGLHAVSGTLRAEVKLWELATGRCVRTLEEHQVQTVALSQDGRHAVSGSWDKTIKLWEVATGRCLRTFEGHKGRVWSVHLSPDARYIVSGSWDKTIRLWEVATGRCLRIFEGHKGPVWSVDLSLDGRWVLSGGGPALRLWEVATGRCIRTFEGHQGSVRSARLSLDGRTALSASDDGTLRLWMLDWELEDRQPADWDEGARPHVDTFLACHTPYVASLPVGDPSAEMVATALTRRGQPAWTAERFHGLLFALGCAGYGWLRPGGVRRELEQAAQRWEAPQSIPESSDAVQPREDALRLEDRRSPAPVALSGFELQLEYERQSSTPSYCVVGKVSGPLVPGLTLEVRRSDGWSSGRMPVETGGLFDVDLPLVDKGKPCLSRFNTTLRDPAGRTLASVDEPEIYYPFPSGRPRLAESLRVPAQGNETVILLEAGTELPATGRCSFMTTKGLRTGSREDLLSIPVFEGVTDLFGGDDSRVSSNLNVGTLVVHGSPDGLSMDLPAGSQVDVTVTQDESRCIEATAHVPLVAADFAATFRPEGFGENADRVTARLEDCSRAIEKCRELLRLKPLPAVAEMLSALEGLGVIAAIEADVSRARAGEREAVYRASKRTTELCVTLAVIEKYFCAREG